MVALDRGSRLPWARAMRAGAVIDRPPFFRSRGDDAVDCVGWVLRWFRAVELLVDPALGLGGAGPAAASRVLARRDALGAGPAADGGVAVVLQRVDQYAVLEDVLLDLLVAPPGERRDLDLLLLVVPSNDRRDDTVVRLGPTQTGRPGVVAGEGLLEWRDLAQRAAQVGVALVQVCAVLGVLLG